MENPSYEGEDVSIMPTRFSAISASNVVVLGREKSKEKLNFVVYFTFLLLGMGSLLPTNFFFTPAMFWHERFATSNSTGNSTHVNQMQEFWQNSLTFVLMGTVLIMSTGTATVDNTKHDFSDTVVGTSLLLNYCPWFNCDVGNYRDVCHCGWPLVREHIVMADYLLHYQSNLCLVYFRLCRHLPSG